MFPLVEPDNCIACHRNFSTHNLTADSNHNHMFPYNDPENYDSYCECWYCNKCLLILYEFRKRICCHCHKDISKLVKTYEGDFEDIVEIRRNQGYYDSDSSDDCCH